MTVKTIFHPATGRPLRFGRRPMVARHPRLRFARYVRADAPPPPASVDYRPLAAAALEQVYLNDQLGCCVIAWIAHKVGLDTGNVDGGRPAVATAAEIKAAYGAIGGYVDGDPATDNGCNEADALAYWISPSVTIGGAAHRIDGAVSINAADPIEVRRAIWLFGGVMFGVALPDGWISPLAKTWDVAGDADPNNGHCFGAVAYDGGRLWIETWGESDFAITDAAVAKYAVAAAGGELFATLGPDWENQATAKAPNGFDYTALKADLAAMA
jgi:hypothetical protein